MIWLSEDFFIQLDIQINEISNSILDRIDAYNKILEIVQGKINEMHNWLIENHFSSQEQEIFFFKHQKPRLISYLIYYNKILDIESKAPCSTKIKSEYFEIELDEIARHINKNNIFYQYYRSKAIHNDNKYFTRNRDKKLRYYESHIINYDTRVSTSHDYNVAIILAHDRIAIYLENKIDQLKNNNQSIQLNSQITWTGNRIDLIEIIYALQTQKVFNYGNADIKELARCFGQMFNIDIDENIYRNYLDIKNRKNNRTKFLNSLSQNLNKRLEAEDK